LIKKLFSSFVVDMPVVFVDAMTWHNQFLVVLYMTYSCLVAPPFILTCCLTHNGDVGQRI
jgi:hypothetical protein